MTGEALVSTPIRIAQCNRCDAYVFLADSAGMRVAADPAPCDRDGYIAALADGRRTFDLATRAGRPHKLLAKSLGGPAPQFDAQGLQRPPEAAPGAAVGYRSVLVEHGCPVNARNARRFEPIEQGPPPTVCETWRSQGWLPPKGKCGRDRNPSVTSCLECDRPPFDLGPTGPEGTTCAPADTAAEQCQETSTGRLTPPGRPSTTSSQGPRAGVTTPTISRPPTVGATRPKVSESLGGRSDPYPKCGTCGRYIKAGELYWGISHGPTWIMAEHEECE